MRSKDKSHAVAVKGDLGHVSNALAKAPPSIAASGRASHVGAAGGGRMVSDGRERER